MLLNILDTADLSTTLRSIRQMENLRRKFTSDDGREGLRLIRDATLGEKKKQIARSARTSIDARRRDESREIAEWLTLWLQSPEMFETWVGLRRRSEDFVSKFGEI
jgi:hypothetical protein